MLKIIKRITCVAIAMLIFFEPNYVMAKEDGEIQEELYKLNNGLKNIIVIQDEEINQSVKDMIVERKWDYTKTVEALNNHESYADVDYVGILAAYMTAKRHKAQREFTYLANVPLIDYSLEEINEDGVLFGKTKKTVLNGYDLLEYYKLGENPEAVNDMETAKDFLSRYVSNEGLYQTIFAKLPAMQLASIEVPDSFDELPEERQALVIASVSMKNMIPYQWGGKASKAGYDTTWWTFLDNGEQKGLDCSGFVQWVYMTAGFPREIYNDLYSSYTLLESVVATEIERTDLEPGDIGLTEGTNNHVGIYIGKVNGEDFWCHLNKASGTVSVGTYNFKRFFTMLNNVNYSIDNQTDMQYHTINDINVEDKYTDNEIYELGQLVVHEAGGEGLNGWIGVCEVVRNRIDSSDFPNDLHEVIWQPGQFENVENIVGNEPSEDILMVAKAVMEGRLSYFENKDVLFYRNPVTTSNIPAYEPVDWGRCEYYDYINHHAFYLKVGVHKKEKG